ncbi:MAG: 5-formyltetrahydrofolate cyclo-ligase [Pseudomonadota bacterium]
MAASTGDCGDAHDPGEGPLDARKTEMRRAAKARRAALAASGRDAAARATAAAFLEAYPPKRDQVVAGYVALGSELDPQPLMAALHAAGVSVCAPVVASRHEPLAFRLWTPDAVLETGPFGARAPRGGPIVTPNLVITPLLAFDAAGGRLGYGGGYYDRTLAALGGRAHAVGYAYAGQRVEAVPMGPHDRRLDMVATEQGVRRCG